MKKFTRESLWRASRTFVQSLIGYACTAIVALDWGSTKESLRNALLGVAISAIASAVSALMNREATESVTDERND